MHIASKPNPLTQFGQFMKSFVIIGGGIIGVTTAYTLAKRGYRVTLIERNHYSGMETSFANGGQLSASNAEVWNYWGTILKGMKWIFKKDAPLLINMKPSWHKASWFAQFIAAIPNYEANTIETARMAIQARQHLFSWAEQEGIDFDLKKEGILHIYRDKLGFDHAGEVSKLLAAGGLSRIAVTPHEMRKIEPTLSGNYYGGYYTESDATGDIHKFTHGLSLASEKLGVKIIYDHEVEQINSDGDLVRVLLKDGDHLETLVFDNVVICAGVGSRELAAQLGDRVNVYPVKGYSITVNLNDIVSQQGAPTVSLLDDETKLVTSRLGVDRFRVAGTAEFNGINKDIRADRIKPLVDWVNQCFPKVSTRSVVPWAGLRPMMPNMLPKVGKGTKSNVYYNTGHGHLGWTLSACTAEMIADIIQADKKPITIIGVNSSLRVPSFE
ncbi:D-amino acid dehydrogenase [Polynucleobacter antarcticus]|uniref:D-amino acid dehydrogenase n=2 Tax=Polynucleobacter antarcticus TaxID=1743162 RepID=A0A6M9PUF3_9BURK|nr:D-amino acid dehydrogenase [Polynucleobacter antarcticus]QKM62395.1 D-amino acid dehydrogenase [Polynucleobacter antarcticus]